MFRRGGCRLPGRGVGRRRRLRAGCGWLGSRGLLLEGEIFFFSVGAQGRGSDGMGRQIIPGQASLVWMGVMSAMLVVVVVDVWWMVLLTLCAWG